MVRSKAGRTRKNAPDSPGFEVAALLQEVAVRPEGYQATDE